MKENNPSFEAVKVENRELDEEGEETEEDGEEFDDDGDSPGQLSEMESSPTPIGAELPVSQSETVAVPSSLPLLSEVPVEYKLQPHELTELKSEVEVSHKQALSVTAQNGKSPIQTLPTQSISSAPCPTPNSSVPRSGSALRIVRTPSTDGYNWRKYGQKQVKIPQGYRSYYKCTYSQCYAKKIECCDHCHVVKEVIYKGQHNHEPPRKVNYARESGHTLPVVESNMTNLASSSKEPKEEIPETKGQNSSGSNGNAQIIVKEQHIDELEPKRRVKKSNSSECAGAPLKPGKKPKFVVHAAGDVGISGDGYRWRKYGQKMVKGNPHPRNYYRCTSAGCPVRKHIERAVENTNALIITYKEKHDHDMPVPKKRHGPPSACLVAAAAPASMNDMQFKRTEPPPPPNQVTATQWSVDMEGELTGEALDLGGEKAMESARTLLSIGFEIKPC